MLTLLLPIDCWHVHYIFQSCPTLLHFQNADENVSCPAPYFLVETASGDSGCYYTQELLENPYDYSSEWTFTDCPEGGGMLTTYTEIIDLFNLVSTSMVSMTV